VQNQSHSQSKNCMHYVAAVRVPRHATQRSGVACPAAQQNSAALKNSARRTVVPLAAAVRSQNCLRLRRFAVRKGSAFPKLRSLPFPSRLRLEVPARRSLNKRKNTNLRDGKAEPFRTAGRQSRSESRPPAWCHWLRPFAASAFGARIQNAPDGFSRAVCGGRNSWRMLTRMSEPADKKSLFAPACFSRLCRCCLPPALAGGWMAFGFLSAGFQPAYLCCKGL